MQKREPLTFKRCLRKQREEGFVVYVAFADFLMFFFLSDSQGLGEIWAESQELRTKRIAPT